MYIQITTRCNMRCAHCCFSCGPRTGMHMEWGTFLDAVNLAQDWGESISLGGGEPTIHPRFKQMIELLENAKGIDYIWMATNGKKKSVVWWLIDYIENYTRKDISIELSLDPYHELIDYRLEAFFRRQDAIRFDTHGHFGVRNTSISRDGIINVGRAVESGVGQQNEHCICPSIMVLPDGRVKGCGCPESPIIGNVREGIEQKWVDFMQNNEDYMGTDCFQFRS